MIKKRKVSTVVLGLAVLLALVSWAILPAAAVSAGDNTVGMVIDPASKTVSAGETFSVDIKVTISAGEAVNTAEAHINFDPAYLEVVSITPGTTMSNVLQNKDDNTAGTIDYVAGAPFPPALPPTADFVLATLNLKAKAVTAATPLTFMYLAPLRKTEAYVGLAVPSLDHSAVSDGSVTMNPALPTQLAVTGITDPVMAGTASSVTVTAKDAYGNTAPSYTGTIHFTSSDAQATLPADYTFQASDNGVKTFSGGVTLKTVGEEWVKATDTVTTTITGEQAAITVTTASGTQLVVTGITDPVVAGTASSVTVTAKDAYGNIATGYTGTIHFTSSDSQATLPADYIFQASDNGVKTFSGGVTLKTVGEQWVKATDTVTTTITGEQTAITVNAAAATQLVVSGITDPVNAGTASSVTVTAKDAGGNIATGYTGTIHFTSSDAQATLPADYTFQASDNGVKTFSGGVTLKTVGEQWVRATDTVTSSITGQQAAITVNPRPVATQLVVSGITDPVNAGTASSVTVTAKDAGGNIATGYTGTIHFTSSDAQATLPADYTFQASDNGVKTFSGGVTLKTAGEQWVKATDTVTSTITGQQTGITVTQPVHAKKTNWGVIIGGIVGGALLLIIAFFVFLRRRV